MLGQARNPFMGNWATGIHLGILTWIPRGGLLSIL